MKSTFVLLLSILSFTPAFASESHRLKTSYDANSASLSAEDFELTAEEKERLYLAVLQTENFPPSLKRELNFKEYRFKVQLIQEEKKNLKILVKLVGIFKTDDWNVIYQNKRIIKGAPGMFELQIPITGKNTPVKITGIDPYGGVWTYKGNISYPLYELMLLKYYQDKNPAKHSFNLAAGLGYTSLSHVEAGTANYNARMLTGKLSFNKVIFPPKFDLGIALWGTLKTISDTRSDADVSMYGFNARLGYIFQGIRYPWRLAIYGGWYYLTMSVRGASSTNTFGFQNVSGPQLFPTVRYSLGNGQSLSAYGKISPISDRLTVLSLTNREVAFGLSYNVPLNERNAIFFTGDYTAVKLRIDSGVLGTAAISQRFLTLGAGFAF